MINLRSFEVPTAVKHAPGAITCLADQVKALSSKRPILVADKGLVKAGLTDHVPFDGAVPNPDIQLVDDAAALHRLEGCDALIGFGSGKPMDAAKAIGVVAVHDGSILDSERADPQPIVNRISPCGSVGHEDHRSVAAHRLCPVGQRGGPQQDGHGLDVGRLRDIDTKGYETIYRSCFDRAAAVALRTRGDGTEGRRWSIGARRRTQTLFSLGPAAPSEFT